MCHGIAGAARTNLHDVIQLGIGKPLLEPATKAGDIGVIAIQLAIANYHGIHRTNFGGALIDLIKIRDDFLFVRVGDI